MFSNAKRARVRIFAFCVRMCDAACSAHAACHFHGLRSASHFPVVLLICFCCDLVQTPQLKVLSCIPLVRSFSSMAETLESSVAPLPELSGVAKTLEDPLLDRFARALRDAVSRRRAVLLADSRRLARQSRRCLWSSRRMKERRSCLKDSESRRLRVGR